MNLNVITSLFVTGVISLQVQGAGGAEEELLIGPDGVSKCILDDHPTSVHKARFRHQDKNGECYCLPCRKGQHVRSFCECEQESLSPKKTTDCGTVGIGQFMNQSNFCVMAYNCTPSCPENQILIRNCTPDADIQCQCKEGWFNPNKMDTGNIPKECQEKPSCPNPGEEPLLVNDGTGDEDTRMFSCQMCRDGYFKKEGDRECSLRRDCQTKAGNQFEDNQCLNDIPSVSESPGNAASPTQDPWTRCDACSCVVAWSFAIAGWIVFLFFGGLSICLYIDRKRLQKELKEQKDEPDQLLAGYVPGNKAEGEDGTVTLRK